MEELATGGARLPRLALGTWQLAGERCRQVVLHALAFGQRAFDTAQGYGNEAELGAALVASGVAREELHVTTKVWPDHLVDSDPLAVVGASLRRLRLERVDLLLLHWPSPRLPLERTLEALERVRAAGLADAIGVSNFPSSLLRRALRVAPVVCDQVEYHPFLAQERLLACCRELDVALCAYSPLARGRVLLDPTLRAIAQRHGRTPAQVSLRWLLQQPGVCALPKASSERHLAENLGAFGFTLTRAETDAIGKLACGMRLTAPEFAPAWDP